MEEGSVREEGRVKRKEGDRKGGKNGGKDTERVGGGGAEYTYRLSPMHEGGKGTGRVGKEQKADGGRKRCHGAGR